MKPRTMVWGIIFTGGLVGALLGAGAAGAVGPPSPPPVGGLPQCQADLATCNTNLTTYSTDLGACNTSLTTCDASLGTCTTSLTQTQAELTTCNTSLGTCFTDLGACNTSLTTCDASLGTCNTSLTQAQADLITCTNNLAACQAATCGNGTVETGEDCDVGTLNSATCETEGFAGGPLACGTGCVFDTSGCYASRFVDNGDGTITDNQMGLMWEKKSDDGSVHDVDNTYKWNTTAGGTTPNGTAFTDFLGALNNCASGNGVKVTGGFASHCDWRLPTIAELKTIIDCSTGIPCVDSVFKAGCVSNCSVTTCSCTDQSFYWSSTTSAVAPSDAWAVGFINAGSVVAGEKNFPLRVRAVRGGP
jgi:hypothetical protein